MDTIRGAIRSKTMWFNLLTFAVAITALKEFADILPQSLLPYMVFINAIGNMLLRGVTDVPLSGK
jgi:hypothetical protein